jgi:hypothetical protein
LRGVWEGLTAPAGVGPELMDSASRRVPVQPRSAIHAQRGCAIPLTIPHSHLVRTSRTSGAEGRAAPSAEPRRASIHPAGNGAGRYARHGYARALRSGTARAAPERFRSPVSQGEGSGA